MTESDRPPPGEERVQPTRLAILEAAYGLFLEQGYHGTSMRQIAQQAGVALGGIYNHFESKDALFTQVLFEYHPIHDVLPALARSEGKSPEEYVHTAAQAISHTLQKRPGFMNLMFIEIVEFGSAHVPLLFESFFPLGLQAVQRFAERQTRLRDLPVPIMLRAFIGLFFSLTVTKVVLGEQAGGIGDAREIEQFADIYLHGILKEAGS